MSIEPCGSQLIPTITCVLPSKHSGVHQSKASIVWNDDDIYKWNPGRAAAQLAEKEREIARLKLQYTVAHCWWDDDERRESPEEHADECGLKLGDEFTLQASTYWEEKFRVTVIPDASCDDYVCEQISEQREEFETYQAMEARAIAAEERLKEAQARKPEGFEDFKEWREQWDMACESGVKQTYRIIELEQQLRQREAELEQARELITRGLELARIVREEVHGLGAPMFPWEIDAATLLAALPFTPKVQP